MTTEELRVKMREASVAECAVEEEMKGLRHRYRAYAMVSDKHGMDQCRTQMHTLLDRQLDLNSSMVSMACIIARRNGSNF